jgi:hypothetical protein
MEYALDPDAPPGRVLSLMARLLLDLAARQEGQEASPETKTPGATAATVAPG